MIWAVVKFQFSGTHLWKEATAPVSFLKNLHRHTFFCEVYVEQKVGLIDEREIEYLQLKASLEGEQYEFHPSETDSCEGIALNIQEYLNLEFPDRKNKVYVYEDNENGCLIE